MPKKVEHELESSIEVVVNLKDIMYIYTSVAGIRQKRFWAYQEELLLIYINV